jgi:uncharacterized membrane protein YjjP (DUF1212 family)
MIEGSNRYIQSFNHSIIQPFTPSIISSLLPYLIMGKKIFLNVLFNIGIMISIFGAYWAYNNNSPLIVAFFAATAIAFVYVKVQLIKNVKNGGLK